MKNTSLSVRNYPYVLICRQCEDIIEYKQAKKHLSVKHKVKLMGMHNDYIKGMMNIYFKFPVMAYRFEDRKPMITAAATDDDDIND